MTCVASVSKANLKMTCVVSVSKANLKIDFFIGLKTIVMTSIYLQCFKNRFMYKDITIERPVLKLVAVQNKYRQVDGKTDTYNSVRYEVLNQETIPDILYQTLVNETQENNTDDDYVFRLSVLVKDDVIATHRYTSISTLRNTHNGEVLDTIRRLANIYKSVLADDY